MDNIPATQAFLNSDIVAADRAGNLYLVGDNSHVRKIGPDGIIATIFGLGKEPDGAPAQVAQLHSPNDLALDAQGNVFISDSETPAVRKVDPQGIISTYAATIMVVPGVTHYIPVSISSSLASIALDLEGHLYLCDTAWHQIHKVSQSGDTVYAGTLSTDEYGTGSYGGDGGPATQAQLNIPWNITIDAAGNLFIADWFNARVRKVSPDGLISTVAGNGKADPVSDFVPATESSLSPTDVAVDAEGNLLVLDDGNKRIRKVWGVAAPGIVAGVPFPGNGDVNRDDQTDLADATFALRGFIGTAPLTPEARAFADTDASRTFDLGDVVRILRKAVGL